MRRILLGSGLLMLLAGCVEPGMSPSAQAPTWQPPSLAQTSDTLPNPLFVPITDPQCVSDMTAEVVDDYFKIAHEEPVHLIGNTLTEGHIETFPEVSPTILEPWRRDTASIDQRVDNTLQTYRRRAVVRILPAENGHWLDVAVFLELEDPPGGPERASAGAATFRYDSSFSRVENPIQGEVAALNWIPRGRDPVLEQRILGHLQFRAQELRGR